MAAQAVVVVMVLGGTTILVRKITRFTGIVVTIRFIGTMHHCGHLARVHANDPRLQSQKDSKQQKP